MFQSPKMRPHPPFLGSGKLKKAFWKPENPVLHLKMPILGPFRAQFEAVLRVAVRGRKSSHLGRKTTFLVLTQKVICEVREAKKPSFTLFYAVSDPFMAVIAGLFSSYKWPSRPGKGLEDG